MTTLPSLFDPVEKSFHEGACRGELLIPYCMSCAQPHWYPRPICPHCGHQETVLKPSAGLGNIYALTRLRQKDAPPNTLIYVELDEGITLLSRLIEDEAEHARIGQRVQVDFLQLEPGHCLPVFKQIKP